MIRIKKPNTKGAYGIGILIPIILSTSSAITTAIAQRRNMNFLSFKGRFIFSIFQMQNY